MPKFSAIAHPVSGLICFHGYKNKELKTMPIDILFLAMSDLYTKTEFEIKGNDKKILINNEVPDDKTLDRIVKYIAKFTTGGFNFKSYNNFEMAVGLSSSSSGYATLTSVIVKSLGLEYGSINDLSKLARKGSFSAASSVVGGLSMISGSEYDPPAKQVFTPKELDDLTLVIGLCNITKCSEDTHADAITSPYYSTSVQYGKNTSTEVIKALESRDIEKLANIVESHNLLNYTVLHSGKNQNVLWRPETISMIQGVRELRKSGYPLFWSMNTGANVYAYCFDNKAVNLLKDYFENKQIKYVITKIGGGVECL